MRKWLISTESESPGSSNELVFLGGTVNGSSWRQKLIPMLKVNYFNPVVENWTEEDKQREEQAKASATKLVYVITPKQSGIYTPIEIAVSTCLNPNKTVYLLALEEDDGETFVDHSLDSVKAALILMSVFPNVVICSSLDELASFINSSVK